MIIKKMSIMIMIMMMMMIMMVMMINAPGRPLYLAEDDTVLDPWVPAFFVFFILVCGAIYI